MSKNATSEEESRGRTDLEVTVLSNGVVNVNRANGSGRAHSVFVGADGGVLRCSCKGHRFHGHCAHVDEIAARPLVTASAAAAGASTPRVATDGGEVENSAGTAETTENGGESGSDGDTDERAAAGGLGTVTGWAGGVEPDTEDETVDETPL